METLHRPAQEMTGIKLKALSVYISDDASRIRCDTPYCIPPLHFYSKTWLRSIFQNLREALVKKISACVLGNQAFPFLLLYGLPVIYEKQHVTLQGI